MEKITSPKIKKNGLYPPCNSVNTVNTPNLTKKVIGNDNETKQCYYQFPVFDYHLISQSLFKNEPAADIDNEYQLICRL